MESKQLVINYGESSIEGLSKEDRELLIEAQNSLEGAYSPYSDFRVASAVRMDSGVVSIAVVAQNLDNKFAKAYPCGACLQVLSEWEMRFKTSIRIIIQIDDKSVQIFDGVSSLMPFSFNL